MPFSVAGEGAPGIFRGVGETMWGAAGGAAVTRPSEPARAPLAVGAGRKNTARMAAWRAGVYVFVGRKFFTICKT
jgi:hypothetical protein